jgi:hypothetical protein
MSSIVVKVRLMESLRASGFVSAPGAEEEYLRVTLIPVFEHPQHERRLAQPFSLTIAKPEAMALVEAATLGRVFSLTLDLEPIEEDAKGV